MEIDLEFKYEVIGPRKQEIKRHWMTDYILGLMEQRISTKKSTKIGRVNKEKDWRGKKQLYEKSRNCKK